MPATESFKSSQIIKMTFGWVADAAMPRKRELRIHCSRQAVRPRKVELNEDFNELIGVNVLRNYTTLYPIFHLSNKVITAFNNFFINTY